VQFVFLLVPSCSLLSSGQKVHSRSKHAFPDKGGARGEIIPEILSRSLSGHEK
jgi:hypothetical protein